MFTQVRKKSFRNYNFISDIIFDTHLFNDERENLKLGTTLFERQVIGVYVGWCKGTGGLNMPRLLLTHTQPYMTASLTDMSP